MKNLVSVILFSLVFATINAQPVQSVITKPPLVLDKVTNFLTVDLSSYATVVTTNALSSQLKTAQDAIANLQAASGGVGRPERHINTSSYTISTTDNNYDLYFETTCKVSFATNLPNTFYCTATRNGGTISSEVVFATALPITCHSRGSKKSVSSQYGTVRIKSEGNNIIHLDGDLK